MKQAKDDTRFRLRRNEQKQQAFDERQPADDGNDNRERTIARPAARAMTPRINIIGGF